MSDRTTVTDASPYPRENFWGSTAQQDESTSTDQIDRRDPNDPTERIAFQLLRETATILCARSLDEDDVPIELTEPQLYIGQSASDESKPGEYGQQPTRRRYNPETGYISGGETTATVLTDCPEAEFCEIVDAWLEYLDTRLPKAHRDALARHARRLKRDGDHSDVEILTRLVRRVRDGEIPDVG